MKHCERKSPNLLVFDYFSENCKKKDLTDRAKRVTYKKNQDYFLHEFGGLGGVERGYWWEFVSPSPENV